MDWPSLPARREVPQPMFLLDADGGSGTGRPDLVFSATDLVGFLACEHLTALDLLFPQLEDAQQRCRRQG